MRPFALALCGCRRALSRPWPWFVLSLLVSIAARAEGTLYAFVDAAGIIHITDRLGDVPEPFLGMYRKEAADRANNKPAAPASANSPPANKPARAPRAASNTSAAAEDQAAARARWQAEVAAWRARLKSSTEALRAAEELVGQANNPIFRELPAGREKLDKAQQAAAEARGQALEARTMLLEVIPKRAKDEHVPPQWLLP